MWFYIRNEKVDTPVLKQDRNDFFPVPINAYLLKQDPFQNVTNGTRIKIYLSSDH